jgi:hypothetical protein
MNWLQKLKARFGRERIAEEKKADEEFRAQIKEALLQQDNLREAVAQMKKVREANESSPPSRAFRQTLRSQT